MVEILLAALAIIVACLVTWKIHLKNSSHNTKITNNIVNHNHYYSSESRDNELKK